MKIGRSREPLLSSVTTIAFSLVSICVTAILIATAIGIIPDERVITARTRADLCQLVATGVTYQVGEGELEQAAALLESLDQRTADLISAGLRFHDGRLVAQVGNHAADWQQGMSNHSDGCYVVPINSPHGTWGALELQFDPIYVGVYRFISASVLKLLCLIVPLVGVAAWWQLSRILKYLDPSRVVPSRVRNTLDSFGEGVVLLDDEDRIVLANEVFAGYLEVHLDSLVGTDLWNLPWDSDCVRECGIVSLRSSSRTGEVIRGAMMKLNDSQGNLRAIFSVNATPVMDDKGAYQGLMAAFADITLLEQNRAHLATTLEALQESRDEISQQNEELRYLATRDPLTSCINRRTFFEQFDAHWAAAETSGVSLSAMMVDIDFFKSINDNYGHGMGDEVLRKVGALLNSVAREQDVVCRYGGEEFSILMPGLRIAEAAEVAETIRTKMSELEFSEFSITASLGISAHALGADDPQGLLDQADKCLYVAKRNGRNQVVCFDSVPAELVIDESQISREKPAEEIRAAATIPFSAVSALLSALSFRDSQTGMHATRVSHFAAQLARHLLGPREVYVVEIAALLHDIGKIGVPDAILLKPGELTPEEWVQMERHDQIGIEIVSRSFNHPGLTEIVKHYHARYDGEGASRLSPVGVAIPLGARVLGIVDAFDAMVSERPYRKSSSVSEALAELRRCAGTQFDPALVERFASLVESGELRLELHESGAMSPELVLSIGEQIERVADAADAGDSTAFVALVERLRLTAEQSDVPAIANAARHAVAVASGDVVLEQLVQESFELLTVCRSLRANCAAPSAGATK